MFDYVAKGCADSNIFRPRQTGSNVQLDYIAREDPQWKTFFLADRGFWPFILNTWEKTTPHLHRQHNWVSTGWIYGCTTKSVKS